MEVHLENDVEAKYQSVEVLSTRLLLIDVIVVVLEVVRFGVC